MPDRQWISESAEALVRELATTAAAGHDCDVLIVGSGYGAAVAAAHLAGATPAGGGEPLRVFVLERGNEYLPGMFPSRFADLPGHVRFSAEDGLPPRGRSEGLFDVRLGAKTSVVVGCGLGGGSLINAAVLAEPKAEAFASGWPQGITLDTMRPFYGLVRAELSADDFSATGVEPPKLASLMRIGKAMGVPDADRFRAHLAIHPRDGQTEAAVERRKCLQCGDCVTGCNHAAKNSLDVTYLRKAHDLGARLFCGATVHRIDPLGAGRPGWNVEAFFTDRGKGYADENPCFTIRARRVVLAAGALGSTEILLRSKQAVGARNVGTRFSGNGDAIAVVERQGMAAHASASEQEAPADRRIGPTINGMVFRRVDGMDGANPWLLFQEFAIPAPLRRVLAEVVATAGLLHRMERPDDGAHEPDDKGEDPDVCGDEALEHVAVIGMQGDDGAKATVELVAPASPSLADGQTKIVRPGIAPYGPQLEQLAMAQAADSGLGGLVVPNPLWEPMPGLSLRRTVTVHPLGGCPLGDDPATSAVDPCGRVRRQDGDVHDDLVVLDGSIVPAALGANPALTIAALAERAMPELMRAWSLDRARWQRPGRRAQPVWRDTSAASPVAPTAVELHECLSGPLRLGGTTWQAELRIHSAPIADLQSFVQRLPRRLDLPQARLTLRDGSGRAALVTLNGSARILHRAASTADSRRAAVAPLIPEWLSVSAAARSHIGELRCIAYELVVDSVGGDAAGLAVQAGDLLRLEKRIAFEPRCSPWRQLAEAQAWLERAGQSQHLGRLALDFGDLAQQATPLLRIVAQQDHPNALGDLASLALLALRLVVKTRLPGLLEALREALELPQRDEAELQRGRTPGTVRWRTPAGDRIDVKPEQHFLPDARAPLMLSRYRPASPAGKPVLLIHGLGASGSTFAHWSIGARSGADGQAAGASLVAYLLAQGREVWVLELRTSIAHAGPPQPWSIEQVAQEDIGPAIAKVLDVCKADKVDVVAHCIGAAMFCMAVLAAPDDAVLHPKIGAVVLSQVGPLMRLGPMNRFRGLVASYLRQFISAEVFDVRPPLPEEFGARGARALLDALLSTFPYPDGDRERERSHDVPGFAVIRHRADAIWGRLVELDNVGDETLARLDEIYGRVSVETLAQTIHFARHALITDRSGANRFVAQRQLAQRFGFPVLLLHGRANAMFDWQGSYDSLRLLKLAFGDADTPDEQPPSALPFDGDADYPPRARGGLLGQGTPRRLMVLDGYGHQDCLIGRNAHRDVFPRMTAFLDEFAQPPARRPDAPPPPRLVADLPWLGPLLGWTRLAETDGDARLRCRVTLRASPARFATLGLAFVPAVCREGRWLLRRDQAVVCWPVPEHWPQVAIDVELRRDAVAAQLDGFAVLTLHDDLPRLPGAEARILRAAPQGPFTAPAQLPDAQIAEAVRAAAERLGDRIDAAIVRLSGATLAAADGARADALGFVVASCQYPAGLLDREPAQATYGRLVERIDGGAAPRPQWLLAVGDQIYADETAGLFDPAGRAGDFARSYERNFRLPGFAAAARRLSILPMLDDHEVRDDWEPLRPEVQGTLETGLRAFEEFQLALGPDDRARAPYRYRVAPGGFPMFVLDTRSARQARSLRPHTRGVPLDAARMVPDTVIDEIDAWLQASGTDRPVFIVSPSLVFPFDCRALRRSQSDRLHVDAWSGFPASLIALFARIARHRPRDLVFLSGDAHVSMVSSFSFSVRGSAPLTVHSIVSSGVYTPWPFANTAPEDLLLDGEVRYRMADEEVLVGRVETPLIVRTPGVALVDVRRGEHDGHWLLAVDFDRPSARHGCSRLLGSAGGWQVRHGER